MQICAVQLCIPAVACIHCYCFNSLFKYTTNATNTTPDHDEYRSFPASSWVRGLRDPVRVRGPNFTSVSLPQESESRKKSSKRVYKEPSISSIISTIFMIFSRLFSMLS